MRMIYIYVNILRSRAHKWLLSCEGKMLKICWATAACALLPLWRKAPCRSWQQDGGERLPRVSVNSADWRTRELTTDALGRDPDHARVVGIVNVGIGARWGIRGRGEGGGVHELLMGRAFTFTGWALLTDVQGTLGSERLWEGPAAISLVVVVDMVAEQPARTLWKKTGGEKRD